MPTTTGRATDFIQFSRASNATVVDSDGKIKWAPHNLLTDSEQFDASSWTKTTTTVTANSVAAPSGSTTAETLTAGGANSTVLQSYTSLGVAYTFGVWLKRKTGTGNVQIAADSGTYTTVTITSDWALYTVSQTPAAGTISAGIRIVTSADEVYAWGAHLYRSDLGGMQANASAYPMYNPTTPRNLLGFTESLTTGWTNTNTTDDIASEVNPVGLTGAVDVAATAGNGTLLASVSLLASPYTFSIWLKRKTGSGTVEITVDGTTYVSAAVTTAWTRFSTTLTPSAGTKTPGIRLVTSGDAVYAWGAQLSDSASLDAYVPNYFAAPSAAAYYGPRLDYDPVTLAAKGLLVEEQRTNLLTYSEQFDNGAWLKSNTSVTANSTISPDGLSTADKITDTDATSTAHLLYQTGVTTAGITYTLTVYAKAAEYSHVQLHATGLDGVIFNIATGSIVSGTGGVITAAGDGWYRCSFTFVANDISVFISQNKTSTSGYSYAGTSGSGIYVYGAQLEAGSFATSYIPTTSASATRAADAASVATSAFPYNAAEGTVVANGSVISTASGSRAIFNLFTSATQFIVIGNNTTGSGGAFADFYVSNSTNQAVLTFSGAVSAGTPFKVSGAYKENDFAASANGSAASTDTSGTVPPVSVAYIGQAAGGAYFNGHIRQITYIPRRLSNAELQARTV